MARGGVWLIAMSACGLVAALSPGQASPAQDAKKVCLDRFEIEKAGGTLPIGMNKTEYVNQCTLSILRNAKLDAELKAAENPQATQSAGENELTARPGDAPKQTTARTPH